MRRHLFILAVLGALLAPGAAHADAITQWNLNASNAIFGVAAQPPQPPCRTWRWSTERSTTR